MFEITSELHWRGARGLSFVSRHLFIAGVPYELSPSDAVVASTLTPECARRCAHRVPAACCLATGSAESWGSKRPQLPRPQRRCRRQKSQRRGFHRRPVQHLLLREQVCTDASCAAKLRAPVLFGPKLALYEQTHTFPAKQFKCDCPGCGTSYFCSYRIERRRLTCTM